MTTIVNNQHVLRINEIKDKLRREIVALKKKKNAVILAHYYQEPFIQDLADYLGDSLALSQLAVGTNADIIVFCGVHFMAETAKILNPSKKVLLPDLDAGCSLSESCRPEAFREHISNFPDHVIITYINSPAEVKAMSHLICTSSNAEAVIQSVPIHRKILFAPDKHLGRYLMNKTGRPMELWDGACEVHEAFSAIKLKTLIDKHPEAQVLVHPESSAHILEYADYIGSTAGIIEYAKKQKAKTFIVVTEAGILHQMAKLMPDKKLIPAPSFETNACACSECRFMKMNTPSKLRDCLLYESPEIILPDSLISEAQIPLNRMMEISNRRS